MLSTMCTIIHHILFKGNGNASNLNYLGLMFCFETFMYFYGMGQSIHACSVGARVGFRAFLFSTTKSPAFFVRFATVNDSSAYNQKRPWFFMYCRLPKVLFCFVSIC